MAENYNGDYFVNIACIIYLYMLRVFYKEKDVVHKMLYQPVKTVKKYTQSLAHSLTHVQKVP